MPGFGRGGMLPGLGRGRRRSRPGPRPPGGGRRTPPGAAPDARHRARRRTAARRHRRGPGRGARTRRGSAATDTERVVARTRGTRAAGFGDCGRGGTTARPGAARRAGPRLRLRPAADGGRSPAVGRRRGGRLLGGRGLASALAAPARPGAGARPGRRGCGAGAAGAGAGAAGAGAGFGARLRSDRLRAGQPDADWLPARPAAARRGCGRWRAGRRRASAAPDWAPTASLLRLA